VYVALNAAIEFQRTLHLLFNYHLISCCICYRSDIAIIVSSAVTFLIATASFACIYQLLSRLPWRGAI